MSGKLPTEIDRREPIEMDAVSQLIGATMDFGAGARSYIDGLEGQAIAPLEFSELSEGNRNALELSSNVIRSLFDEMANTFFEPLRETQPAVAERGYQMLWAALKAASIIGVHTESETKRFEAGRAAAEEAAGEDEKQDKMEACRGKRKEKADALYEVVKAIMSREPNLSAERIAPKVPNWVGWAMGRTKGPRFRRSRRRVKRSGLNSADPRARACACSLLRIRRGPSDRREGRSLRLREGPRRH